MKYLGAKKRKKFLGFPSSFLCIVIIREITVKKSVKLDSTKYTIRSDEFRNVIITEHINLVLLLL